MSNEKSQLSSELNQLQDRHVLLQSNHDVLKASREAVEELEAVRRGVPVAFWRPSARICRARTTC